jgi:multidrug resistance efflux pump
MRRRRWFWLAALGVLLLGGGWLALRTARPGAAPLAGSGPAGESRVVAQAQISPIDGFIEVRPLAQGRVLRVLVHPGDRVASGQLLAEIENDLESAGVRQRRADRAVASARLDITKEGVRPEEQAALQAAAEAAQHDAELAQDRAQRQHELRAQGFVSEQAVVESERSLAAAAARAREADLRASAGQRGGRTGEVAAARDEVASADAALAQQQVALSRTRILAPTAGVIMARNVNPGDVIGPNLTAPTLFRLVDPSRIEVRFEVEELLAAHMAQGLTVQFVLPGDHTLVGHGVVTRIAPQVEKRSIGADDARIRADSMIRPAWADFVPEAGYEGLPVNYRLEAWVQLRKRNASGAERPETRP